MKTMYRIFLYMVCLNVSTYLVSYMLGLLGMTDTTLTPQLNPTQIITTFNPVTTAAGWTTGVILLNYLIGDIVGGLNIMMLAMAPLITGFPLFLSQMGVPSVIVYAVTALEGFVVTWGVYEWISGRNATQQ